MKHLKQFKVFESDSDYIYGMIKDMFMDVLDSHDIDAYEKPNEIQGIYQPLVNFGDGITYRIIRFISGTIRILIGSNMAINVDYNKSEFNKLYSVIEKDIVPRLESMGLSVTRTDEEILKGTGVAIFDIK